MLTTCCSTFLLSRLCKAPYDTIRRLIASQAIVERLSIGNSESMPSLHKCTNLVLIPNLVTRKLRNLEPFRHSFRYTRYLHTSPFVCKVKGKKAKKTDVFIRQEDVEEYISMQEVNKKMDAVIEDLKDDYVQNYRVGGELKMLEKIEIDLDGKKYQLSELAEMTKKSMKKLELNFVSFPEALSIAETAIHQSELNLNPSSEGTIITVPIPDITTERRKVLVKAAKKRAHAAKDQLRKLRSSSEKQLRQFEKIPKDTLNGIKKQIGAYIEVHNNTIDDIFKGKEDDLMLH